MVLSFSPQQITRVRYLDTAINPAMTLQEKPGVFQYTFRNNSVKKWAKLIQKNEQMLDIKMIFIYFSPLCFIQTGFSFFHKPYQTGWAKFAVNLRITTTQKFITHINTVLLTYIIDFSVWMVSAFTHFTFQYKLLCNPTTERSIILRSANYWNRGCSFL